jgi:hypothetical protein
MPVSQPNVSTGVSSRPRLSLRIASVEYRIQWNELAQAWDVLRNGAATEVVARKKRTSAVASAIRDAKAEFAASSDTVVVNCLEGPKLETLWKGTQ